MSSLSGVNSTSTLEHHANTIETLQRAVTNFQGSVQHVKDDLEDMYKHPNPSGWTDSEYVTAIVLFIMSTGCVIALLMLMKSSSANDIANDGNIHDYREMDKNDEQFKSYVKSFAESNYIEEYDDFSDIEIISSFQLQVLSDSFESKEIRNTLVYSREISNADESRDASQINENNSRANLEKNRAQHDTKKTMLKFKKFTKMSLGNLCKKTKRFFQE
uniref:Uncharacterized protein n=1 Tax=Corethron hystrix TaxID=216773 RepID=A0A7S1FZH2_9STRA|mmetsp:Transcript_40401/g.94930  ORF Transcript_40401/g.94930 Transcript_40401/m.94930 type:complete len:217 (+) Transcript_40401:240-890(+)